MTTISVLYWKEVPVQIQAITGADRVSRLLDNRFQEAADAIAMFEGSFGSDAYLDAWEWQTYEECDEDAEPALDRVAAKFNGGMPEDFVARIRDAHHNGTRDESPGSINHWLE